MQAGSFRVRILHMHVSYFSPTSTKYCFGSLISHSDHSRGGREKNSAISIGKQTRAMPSGKNVEPECCGGQAQSLPPLELAKEWAILGRSFRFREIHLSAAHAQCVTPNSCSEATAVTPPRRGAFLHNPLQIKPMELSSQSQTGSRSRDLAQYGALKLREC